MLVRFICRKYLTALVAEMNLQRMRVIWEGVPSKSRPEAWAARTGNLHDYVPCVSALLAHSRDTVSNRP